MRQKEPQHLAARIRAARLRVGATEAAARPGMAGAVDAPLLKQRCAITGRRNRAGVGQAPWGLALADLAGKPSGASAELIHHLITVDRVDGLVFIAVEHDRRDRPAREPPA